MAVSISLNFEAITLSDVKAFVRVDTDAHDALLTDLTNAAMYECFNLTHCVFGTATAVLQRWEVLDRVDLPYAPVTAITEVMLDGTVVDASNYEIQSNILKIDAGYSETLKVTYTVGMAMPADVKHAILQRVKYGYDYGDDLPQNQQPRFFDRVLMRYRDHKTFAG